MAITTIPDAIRQRLACPTCHGSLRDDADTLVCNSCSRTFAVSNAIPVMLDEESLEQLSSARSEAENVALRARMASRPFLSRAVALIRPPHPFLFTAGRNNRRTFGESVMNASTGRPFVLDVGSGILGTSNTSGLPPQILPGIVAMEIAPTRTTSVTADAHKIPFADTSCDGVLIQGVLEHVESPERIVDEIERVLRQGGYVYAEVPFIQHYHQDPEDYRRYTLTGIRRTFAAFEEVTAGVSAGPSSALCDVLIEYFAVWFDHPLLYWGAKFALGWLVLPLRYLDYALAGRKRAHSLAGALYFLGRKRAAPASS